MLGKVKLVFTQTSTETAAGQNIISGNHKNHANSKLSPVVRFMGLKETGNPL